VDRYVQYSQDAVILGRIGEALFPQDTKLAVRLPADLAESALSAWHREDSHQTGDETPEQRLTRHRAAYLALIGLCIENTGRPDAGEVICELDAWYIGSALETAGDQGLLSR
jgi:hypothetical protein